jgi:hypothetical protein
MVLSVALAVVSPPKRPRSLLRGRTTERDSGTGRVQLALVATNCGASVVVLPVETVVVVWLPAAGCPPPPPWNRR